MIMGSYISQGQNECQVHLHLRYSDGTLTILMCCLLWICGFGIKKDYGLTVYLNFFCADTIRKPKPEPELKTSFTNDEFTENIIHSPGWSSSPKTH